MHAQVQKHMFKNKSILIFILICIRAPVLFSADVQESLENLKNPTAIKEVYNGKRKVANAAWWGFNERDSTDALKGAIESGAPIVIVPNMGKDWIVMPLRLRSNLELIFEAGVVVTAKKYEFKNTGDSLFKAVDKHNIVLRGYGATLKMQKRDYIGANYKQGQWRMVLNIARCSNVEVLGLTIRESGGDGIYLGSGGANNVPCKNVIIKDCIFDNNYRQGISVISAENLRIDNCIFKNTSGQQPGAGIDIEPNHPSNKAVNIIVTNCISEGNEGPGFVVGLHHLSSKSSDVSILFNNCLVKNCKWGVQVLSNNEEGPKGLIEFNNCSSEDTLGAGIWVASKTNSFNLRFRNYKIKNAGLKKIYQDERFDAPIFIRNSKESVLEKSGYIEFENCYVYDTQKRPAIKVWAYEKSLGKLNIKGDIYVHNPCAKKLSFGLDIKNNLLKVESLK